MNEKYFFLFIIIILIKSYCSSIFKTITLNNGDYLIINKRGLYTYNKDSLSLIESYKIDLDETVIEKISYFELSAKDNIFILIKNNLFIFSNEGKFKYKNNILENKEVNNFSINYLKSPNSIECQYFIEYTNSNNNLVIELYKYDFSLNLNNLIDSKEFNIIINNSFSCQVMINTNNEEHLTCFYESENKKNLLSSKFYVDNHNKISYLNNNNYQINGAKMIKSEISYNKIKSLICFINNLDNGSCLIYNINENKFNEYITPLNNCLSTSFSSFNIKQIDNDYNYLLYCFYSSTELSIVKLNKEFKMISDINDYKIDYSSLEECKDNYFSTILYTLNKINILSNCNIDDNLSLIIYTVEQEYIDIYNMKTNIPLSSIEIKMNKIMSKIQIGNSYFIKGDDYNVTISLINEEKEGTYIELLECEEKLRNAYNYANDIKLIIFQVEIYIDDDRWINNNIQYAIFNEDKIRLNLSVCKDEEIIIYYKIKNKPQLNLTRISHFDELGVNVFKRGDPFFNDICFPYSEGNSDIILRDRINYIYQNYSLCDSGCIYEKIEIEKNTIRCKCSILSKFNLYLEDFEPEEVKNLLLQNSTLGVIKCYNLVFNLKNKLKNVGLWITIIAIIGHIPILIFYICLGTIPIQKYVEQQMDKFHYLI